MKYAAIIALLLASAGATQAQVNHFRIDTGNDLYALCTGQDTQTGLNYCAGYVRGSTAALNSTCIISVPNNVTNNQAISIVVKYLTDFPELRNEDAGVLMVRAFVKAFPRTDVCKNMLAEVFGNAK